MNFLKTLYQLLERETGLMVIPLYEASAFAHGSCR
jgi:hypothetical protein